AINVQAKIKWPNDVLIRGRKVCGILIEQRIGVRSQESGVRSQESGVRSQGVGGRERESEKQIDRPLTPDSCLLTPVAAIVGIGLNGSQSAESFGQGGLPDAGSLALFAKAVPERDEMARRLLEQLDEEYERLCQGDWAMLEAHWKWRVGLLGKLVRAECHDG